MHYVLVAAGGALGAMSRSAVYNLLMKIEGHTAVATFIVNIVGSFVIGAMFVLITEKAGLPENYRDLITIGFLGAFTTYSTYSLDALRMFESGEPWLAIIYLVGTMLVCLLSVWLGASLIRHIF